MSSLTKNVAHRFLGANVSKIPPTIAINFKKIRLLLKRQQGKFFVCFLLVCLQSWQLVGFLSFKENNGSLKLGCNLQVHAKRENIYTPMRFLLRDCCENCPHQKNIAVGNLWTAKIRRQVPYSIFCCISCLDIQEFLLICVLGIVLLLFGYTVCLILIRTSCFCMVVAL